MTESFLKLALRLSLLFRRDAAPACVTNALQTTRLYRGLLLTRGLLLFREGPSRESGSWQIRNHSASETLSHVLAMRALVAGEIMNKLNARFLRQLLLGGARRNGARDQAGESTNDSPLGGRKQRGDAEPAMFRMSGNVVHRKRQKSQARRA